MAQELLDAVKEAANEVGFGIWFLLAVALIFFMQAGFAMVETWILLEQRMQETSL